MPKNKFREYMLLRSRNSQFRPEEYPGFNAVEKIAIAFESGEANGQILKFAAQLRKMNKEVHLLGYVPKKLKELKEPPVFDFFSLNDLNWYGKPKSDDVTNFLKPHYGVYISLNKRAGSPLEFISAAIGSDFNISLKSADYTRFDLIVGLDKENNYEKLFEEILFYLNFINTTR